MVVFIASFLLIENDIIYGIVLYVDNIFYF